MNFTTLRVLAELAPLLRLDRHGCLAPTARLDEDLAMDSLDRQSLACELDVAFGIEIPDDDIALWQTVADVARTVDRLLEPRGGLLDRPAATGTVTPLFRVAQPNYAALGLGSAEEAAGRN